AVLGVYGVMTYMVSTRTREIGVRVALGASRGDIVRLILAHAMPVIVAGTIAGSLGSLVLSRLLSALLFEVSPTDPGTIAAGALLLTAVALAACCVPVRMALAVDPVRVLQRE
ncbi:MAG: FtsX-like permease family protein, partial [Candidatus Korobacteraceae bacterium]